MVPPGGVKSCHFSVLPLLRSRHFLEFGENTAKIGRMGEYNGISVGADPAVCSSKDSYSVVGQYLHGWTQLCGLEANVMHRARRVFDHETLYGRTLPEGFDELDLQAFKRNTTECLQMRRRWKGLNFRSPNTSVTKFFQ